MFTKIAWLLAIVRMSKVADATKLVDDIACVLKQKDWVEEDYLLLSWALPANVSRYTDSDLYVTARWYRDIGSGTCSEVTLTSCKMNYGDDSSPRNFELGFNLTVTITAGEDVLFKKTALINSIEACREPPGVDSVSANSLNSSCVTVTWAYIEQQYCSDLRWKKTYQICYRRVHKGQILWKTHVIETKSRDTCTGTAIICGLSPYTVYEIGLECRGTNIFGEETAWSEPATLVIQTKESVPSAAPEVTSSGFSYNKRDCVEDGMREVTIYWKTLPEEYVQGVLRGYRIEIYKIVLHSQTFVRAHDVLGDDAVSFTTDLSCTNAYVIFLKAFTVIGTSEESSSIIIPKSEEDLDVDVIPMVQEANKDVLVTWFFHKRIAFNKTCYRLFWCQKSLDGKCQKHFNWTLLSNDDQHYLLKAAMLAHPIHKYVIGISVETINRRSGIIWSHCLYAEDKDLKPPGNVRLRNINVEGILKVEWDNPSCASGTPGPYITSYKVYICALKKHSENNCSGTILIKDIDRHENSAILSQLDASHWYGVYVIAETRSMIVRKSKFIKGQPFQEGPGLSPLQIVGIATGTLIVLLLMIIGIAAVYRCIWMRLKPERVIIGDPLQETLRQQQEGFL